MGELPENVFLFQGAGLDNIYKLDLIDKEELYQELGLPFVTKVGVVTYHPVTLEKGTTELQISELLQALRSFLIFIGFLLYPMLIRTEGLLSK